VSELDREIDAHGTSGHLCVAAGRWSRDAAMRRGRDPDELAKREVRAAAASLANARSRAKRSRSTRRTPRRRGAGRAACEGSREVRRASTTRRPRLEPHGAGGDDDAWQYVCAENARLREQLAEAERTIRGYEAARVRREENE
jgi:hypothetical protein